MPGGTLPEVKLRAGKDYGNTAEHAKEKALREGSFPQGIIRHSISAADALI